MFSIWENEKLKFPCQLSPFLIFPSHTPCFERFLWAKLYLLHNVINWDPILANLFSGRQERTAVIPLS